MKLLKKPHLVTHVLAFISSIFFLQAQEFSAGINTENPNPNAVLHLVAPNSDQGLLIPSLTTAQRTGMSLTAADNGLMVFDSDINAFFFWVNPSWIANTNTDNQTLSLAGNNLSIGNGNTVDLSSINTDNQNLTLAGTNLSIAGGNTVDLTTSGFLTGLNIDATTLNGDGDVTPLAVNIGTGPGQIVQLGASSELPAVDGSFLTGVVTSETDPTVLASVKDGVDWTEVTSIPAGFADGIDDGIVSETQDLSAVISINNSAGNNNIIDVLDPINPQDAATRNYVDTQGFISSETQDLSAVISINNSAGNNNIIDVLDPINPQDAATRNYVDTQGFISSETQDLSAVISINNSAGNNNIIDVLDPINPQDAATRNYVDTQGFISSETQDLSAVISINNSAGNNNIIDVLDPINPQDAATKNYVDANLSSIPLTDGNILIGDGVNTAAEQVISGDATLSNTGVLTIANNVIVDADISGSAAIAGSKITPNFGAQAVSTSGDISGNNLTASGTITGNGTGITNLTANNLFTTTAPTNGDVLTFNAGSWDAVAATSPLTAGDGINIASNNINLGGILSAPAIITTGAGSSDLTIDGAGRFITNTAIETSLNSPIINLGDAGSDNINIIGQMVFEAGPNDVTLAVNTQSNPTPTLRIPDLPTSDETLALSSEIGSTLNLPFNPPSQAEASDLFAITQTGSGLAGSFIVNNPSSTLPALQALSDGAFNSYALLAQSNGGGDAARISYDNASGTAQAMNVFTSGLGKAATFSSNNAGSTDAVLEINHAGSGPAIISNAPITTNAQIGIGVINPAVSLDVATTDAIKFPVGTTAEQPGSPLDGMMRYNSDIGDFEGYISGSWTPIGGSNFQMGLTEDFEDVVFGTVTTPVFEAAGANKHLGIEAESGQAILNATSFGVGSELRLTRGNGTKGGEANITNGNVLGELVFAGRTNVPFYQEAASIGAEATEDFTGNSGTDLIFRATTAGSSGTTEMMRIKNGSVGIGTNNPAVSLDISGSDAIRLPVGNNAQRPIATIGDEGLIRYSVEPGAEGFEGFDGSVWQPLGGSSLVSEPNVSSIVGGTGAAPGLTGTNNTVYGVDAGNSLSTGVGNTLVGFRAGNFNTVGGQNTMVGNRAGLNVTGDENILVGFQSGQNITSGSSNVIIGTQSGLTNLTGDNLTLIGQNADVSVDGLNNATAIGNNAIVGSSNSLVLGGTGADAVNVGIGTENPRVTFQVGDLLGMSHFRNDVDGDEPIEGDVLAKNIYVDYTLPTQNQLFMTNNDSASFIFMGNGEIAFMSVDDIGQDNQVDLSDISTDVRPWLEMKNDGDSYFNGAVKVGNTVGGQDGMIRYNGSTFEGYSSGSWNPLGGGGFTLPYNPGPVSFASNLFELTQQDGGSSAGRFTIDNTASVAAALIVETNSNNTASRSLEVRHSGSSGDAGSFSIFGGDGTAMFASTDGAGSAITARKESGSTGTSVNVVHDGASGSGLFISIGAVGNPSAALDIANSGTGPDIRAATGAFTVNNAGGINSSPSSAVDGLAINQANAARGISVNMNGGVSPGLEIINSGGPSIITDGFVDIGSNLDVNGNVTIQTDLNVMGRTLLGGDLVSNVTGPLINNGNTPSRILELADGADINDINGGVAGKEIILIATGPSGATVNHNTGAPVSTIRLNAGINFIMAQYSTLHLVYVSNTVGWVEIGRAQQ